MWCICANPDSHEGPSAGAWSASIGWTDGTLSVDIDTDHSQFTSVSSVGSPVNTRWTQLVRNDEILPPPRRICNRRCLSVCLSPCLLATLRKNFWTDLHEIFREGWQWVSEQMIKFWWRSESRILIWTAILVRRAMAEVCTVAVLLLDAKIYRPCVT